MNIKVLWKYALCIMDITIYFSGRIKTSNKNRVTDYSSKAVREWILFGVEKNNVTSVVLWIIVLEKKKVMRFELVAEG